MVIEYIRTHWDECIRKKGNSKDALDLPYTYTSPCAIGLFDDLFYWDTYFINRALLLEKRYKDAKNNILNMAFLINKYGYMPNAASYALINRTQMPFFILMCYEFYEATKDLNFVKEIYDSMVAEYNFWMTKRITPSGLNRFDSNANDYFKLFFSSEYENRVKVLKHQERNKIEIGANALAECESGWDFSPRFNQEALNYNPIDLNSLLYKNELILSEFSKLLKKEDIYLEKSNDRKKRILNLLKKEDGFYDYNYKSKKSSNITTCAAFLPFVFGISSDINILKNILSKLEFEYGVSSGENKKYDSNYQWFYPNMWPNLVLFAYEALKNNGLVDDAIRIAKKYMSVVDKEFMRTGKLWEKYDVIKGEKSSINEYQETEMMGWTAGVYSVLFYDICKGE